MRVAALNDVHGNIAALEAVLADPALASAEAIVLGGDVAAGGFPSETLERLRGLGDRVHWVRGNADRELTEPEGGLAAAAMLDWVRGRLTEEQLAYLHGRPTKAELDVDGIGRTLFCHATPRNDIEIFTAVTPAERLHDVFAGVDANLVVCGHTHMQFDRMLDGVRVVNAGSVGMPYEDEPGAYWALLGPDVDLRRTEYDVEAAIQAIEQAGWPGEWPRGGREETTAHFETLAIGSDP
ncbi:MAG TPA: metallophosphoesterase family protein [Gaiellaceae bacterium]